MFKTIYFFSLLFISYSPFAKDVKCLMDKNKKYVNLKKDWLKESQTILEKAMPEEKKLIDLMTREQLSRVNRRLIAVEVLLKEKANKSLLDTTLPVPVWVTLNEAQREELGKRNERYFKINEKTKKLTTEFSSKDKTPLKELYAVRVRNDQKWLDSIANFNANIKKINEIICQ